MLLQHALAYDCRGNLTLWLNAQAGLRIKPNFFAALLWHAAARGCVCNPGTLVKCPSRLVVSSQASSQHSCDMQSHAVRLQPGTSQSAHARLPMGRVRVTGSAGRLYAPCSGFLGRLDGHHHEAWDCSGVPLLPSGGRRFLKERRPAHTTAIVGCWGEDALYLHSAFS